jgi:hypothetical protein
MDWREEAKDVYREAQAELGRWPGTQPPDIEYLKEDLREAMLDIKQAVIDDRSDDAIRFGIEAVLLVIELKRLRGESNA